MNTYGPYSAIRKTGILVFTSGQVGVDPKTQQAKKDIIGQTIQAMDNLSQLIIDNGLSMTNVIKTTVYLTDMTTFSSMNEVYMTYFADSQPARVCVEVAGLPNLANNRLLIEIDAVVAAS